MSERFPGNSYTQKDAGPKKVKRKTGDPVKPVVKKAVKKKHKSIVTRFRDTFFAMDFGEAIKRVLVEVLIPDTQGTMSEMLKGTVDMMFYGDRRGRGSRRNTPGVSSYNPASYLAYHNPNGAPRNDPRPDVSRPVSKPVMDDLVFESRDDAEDVLEQLANRIAEYGAASVRDLYGLAGMSADYTKERYGWCNIEGANVFRCPDGWLLDLPRPIVID